MGSRERGERGGGGLLGWCEEKTFLETSTCKTKDMIFNPKSICLQLPMVISDQAFEQVLYVLQVSAWVVHEDNEIG